MTSVRLAAFLLCLACAAPALAQPRAAPPAAAAGNKIEPIGEAFPFLARYYAVPAAERNAFRLGYTLSQNNRPFRGRVWLLDPAGSRVELPVAANGELRRLPTPEQLRARGWRAEFEAPAGSRLSYNLNITPTAVPAAEMAAEPVARSVAQANGAIRRAAGLMRFAAPTMTRVVFVGAGTGEVVDAQGRAAALPVANGNPSFTPAQHPNARTLRFARPPTRLSISPAAPRPRR